ncbi:type IV secretory system conjugative DNA transfer family protein [Roseibium aggregatum]|nr:type IV secretory system conjugative DNA transfer family protein [Roseibium aggregatum]
MLVAPAIVYFFLIGFFAFLGTMGMIPVQKVWSFVPLMILQVAFVVHKWHLLGLAAEKMGYAAWQAPYLALSGHIHGGQIVILATMVALILCVLETWFRLKTARFIGPWLQEMEIKLYNKFFKQDFIRSESGTHGTADWLKMKDFKKMLVPSKMVLGYRMIHGPAIRQGEELFDAIPIGVDDGGFFSDPKALYTKLIGHILVCAGSGAGKTLSIADPASKFFTGSMIVTDPQDEIRPISARHRAEVFGHKIRIIKPGSEDTHGINPMGMLDPEDENFQSQIERIGTLLYKEPKDSENSFWNNNSKRLMGAIMALEVARYKVAPEEFTSPPTLRNVHQYLSMSPNDIQEYLRFYCKQVEPGYYGPRHSSIVQLGLPLIGLDDRTFSNVTSSAVEDLKWLGDDKFARVVCSNTIDPMEVLTDKMTVYINMSTNDMDGREGLVRIILGTFIETQLMHGNSGTPVLYIVDEMLQLGPMKTLHNRALTMGRKAGIRLLGIIQSLQQFEDEAGKSAKSGWMDNSKIRFFSAAGDNETCKEISDSLGTATVRGYNSRGDGRQNILSGNPSGEADSYNESARPLMTPGEVMQMPLSHWLLTLQSKKPIRIRKIAFKPDDGPLYRHPSLENVGDENPYVTGKPYPALPAESIAASIKNTPSEAHLYRPLPPIEYRDAEQPEAAE